MGTHILFVAVSLIAAPTTMLSAMKWEKRVLLVSAPDAKNPSLNHQRRIIAQWKRGADDRDLVVVEIVGQKVAGANDAAATLRTRYRLSTTGFAVVLIGKDGSPKLRATNPISASMLENTIDAMPMRRGGNR